MDPDITPRETKKDYSALTKDREIKRFGALENLQASFRPHERLLLYGFSMILGISAFAILAMLNMAVSTTVPAGGGTLIEGAVGPARFINPILAISHTDQDLSVLLYSGLMRALPHGEIVPDLASEFTISEDGTTYTFKLRDAQFHDGKPVTSADVLHTISLAQNPEIKSPRRADWEGVQVSAPDDKTVVFKLQKPYAPFIFNATLGILPKHLWQGVPAQEFPFSTLNTSPVGSGPFMIDSVETDKTGAAQSYDLVPFKHFTLGSPYLKRVTFLFYPNEKDMVEAFNAGHISAMAGISPSQVGSLTRSDTHVLSTPLPRVFGVFFNQSKAAVLADSSARAALNAAIDKEALVDQVLGGYGVSLEGPIPPGVLGIEPSPQRSAGSASSSAPAFESQKPAEAARSILSRGGWTWSEKDMVWTKKSVPLTFSLATADEPELVATANKVADFWRAAGIPVNVHVYSLSEINTNIIRPRQYDALLFGEVVGREGDLFAFWHSSQRNDPGLNLAMYVNSRADALLAQARATVDQDERDELYKKFESIVKTDIGAVFLYSPEFLYVAPNKIEGIEIGALTIPAERFLNAYQWYTDTQRVWEIFAHKPI